MKEFGKAIPVVLFWVFGINSLTHRLFAVHERKTTIYETDLTFRN